MEKENKPKLKFFERFKGKAPKKGDTLKFNKDKMKKFKKTFTKK